MSEQNNYQRESSSIKQLQRALFYESQFRNAIVTDAISFYDVNITKDLIENDFFFKDDDNNFISVPDYLGLTTPCRFSDFLEKWAEFLIPESEQKVISGLSVLRETLLEIFEEGKREYLVNYWAQNIVGKKIFLNQRFLLTKNEVGDICALVIIKDYTKLKALDDEYLKSELELYAYTDPITNGYNYIKFKEKLRERNIPGSIICLDIHSFKTINSICGVSKGDEVIKHIWDCILLSINTKNGDLAAHINADHYIIYIPTNDDEVIIKTLKSISLTLMIISVDLDVPKIQPYFGVSKWSPDKKIEMAYNEAITAKHNAKYQQNIDYAFFNDEDTTRLIREKEMIDSFEDALKNKEFKVWFQPKYRPKTKTLVGAEALVRWIKDDGVVIRPDDFIKLFERNNIIRKLDEYIFKTVCQKQKEWLDKGMKIVPVSVNLSRASLYYTGVAAQYKHITNSVGLDSKWVPIEITESAAVEEETVKDAIDKFHSLGFSLQMDDFGTGYSSLASLNMLHFDTLKIDKSLVDFIGQFDGNRLIEHTISLAKELGIQITAEGVETEEQVQFLKNIGCDNIQGFFYSKPIPADDYSLLLENPFFEDKNRENRKDYIEEHINEFNQEFTKPVLYTFVINLSKDELKDYSQSKDWMLETNLNPKTYSEAVELLCEKNVVAEYQIAFKKALNRDNLIEEFSGFENTKIIEYKRHVKEKNCKFRLIIHTFKVEKSNDIWLYLKSYNLG